LALEEKLRDIFVRALELTSDADLAKVRFRRHPHWDSLGHYTLMVAIEEEFGVELDPDQFLQIESFDIALAVLRGIGVNG